MQLYRIESVLKIHYRTGQNLHLNQGRESFDRGDQNLYFDQGGKSFVLILEFPSGDLLEEDGDEFVALIGSRQLLLEPSRLAARYVVRVQLQIPLLTQQTRCGRIGIFVAGSLSELFAVFRKFVRIFIHLHAVVRVFFGDFFDVSEQLLRRFSFHFPFVELEPLHSDIVEPKVVLADCFVIAKESRVLTRSLSPVLPSHLYALRFVTRRKTGPPLQEKTTN